MKSLFVLFAIIVVALIAACKNPNTTTPTNHLDFLNDSNWTEVTDTSFYIFDCINWFNERGDAFRDSAYVINDSNEYLALYNYRLINYHDCNNYQLPDIRFSERTLLGYGCDISHSPRGVDLKFNIYKNEILKSYLYQIIQYHDTIEFEMSAKHMFWISIPKMPNDYSVRFSRLDSMKYK